MEWSEGPLQRLAYSASVKVPLMLGNHSCNPSIEISKENTHSEHLMSAAVLPLRANLCCFHSLRSRLHREVGTPVCTYPWSGNTRMPVDRLHPESHFLPPPSLAVKMDGKAKPPCASTKPWLEMK